jgi:radical SAM protein with 4Fe4S-binding SPASM domain
MASFVEPGTAVVRIYGRGALPAPARAAALPRHAQIEPVGQCNLRCRMCPIAYRPESAQGQPPALLDVDVYVRLLDQLGPIEELHLQGLGEPLMHPRFFDLVSIAARRGIRVSTNTNLTLLTDRRAALCLSSGLHAVYASIDGASAEVYERIRVRANFAKVLRNLRRLVAARHAAARGTPEIHVVAVAMRENVSELPALVRLAAAERVDSLWVQHLCHDYGEATLPGRYAPMRSFIAGQTLVDADPVVVGEAFSAARREAERLGVELRLPNLVPRLHAPDVPGPQRCDWPWRSAYVTYDGTAMPCCMVGTPDRASLGNMAREGVAAVWNGARYRAFRAALSSPEPPEVCRRCSVYTGTF